MKFETVIIGAGPAGTGILFKALRDGSIKKLLDKGIAIIEQGSYLLNGSIVSYDIKSDSIASVFLECLEGQTSSFLDLTYLENVMGNFAQFNKKPIPLNSLSAYFTKLGKLLEKFISKHSKCKVLLNTRALNIRQVSTEEFHVYTNQSDTPIIAKKVILATGGHPKIQPFFQTKEGTQIPILQYDHKIINSDQILKGIRPENLFMDNKINPRVVILGSGPSGFAAANYILNNWSTINFLEAPIKIIGKKAPKLFFDSEEEAYACNYLEFDKNDLCTQTKRLFRLAGLRMESKVLYMRMCGMVEGEQEKRVTLNCVEEEEVGFELEKSDIIVSALGYTLNTIPIINIAGEIVKFKGDDNGRYVNNQLQLIGPSGQPLKNIFSIGLGNGFIPFGDLGGEPSFKGQFSGVWYYQNEMGKIVLDQLLTD